ncbi:hypothetical protein FRC06_008035 [Ceratobasidium sp. 370]|nr:hypothetical protein FRC06_008035 [Ceratobasidium sp. 370]
MLLYTDIVTGDEVLSDAFPIYMKAVKAELQKTSPERVDAFEKGAAAYAKKIVANFKDFEFYTGESMNPDGIVLLLNYREDGVTPYFTVWKDGVKEVKL